MLNEQYLIDDLYNRTDLVRLIEPFSMQPNPSLYPISIGERTGGSCRTFIWSVLVLLILGISSIGQTPAPGGVTLVDEFGELCSDDIRARIDSFFVTISERPDSVGYVVGHADATIPGRYHKFVRLIKNHINFRNFDPTRVKFVRGADRADIRIQFWLTSQGASFRDPMPPYKQSAINAPTLFDASGILPLDKGEISFGEESDEPCDFGLDLTRFADEVKTKDETDVVLVATSDREHSERFVRKVLRLTKKKLTKEHAIVPARIRTIYMGPAKSPEMQLWIVPKGMPAPLRFTSRLRDY